VVAAVLAVVVLQEDGDARDRYVFQIHAVEPGLFNLTSRRDQP